MLPEKVSRSTEWLSSVVSFLEDVLAIIPPTTTPKNTNESTVLSVMPTIVANTYLKNCRINLILSTKESLVPPESGIGIAHHTFYVLAGTNLGDKRQHLRDALQALSVAPCKVLACSKVYESEPWGMESQHSFLNVAFQVECSLAPEGFLSLLKHIESLLGRAYVPGRAGYQDRVIDLDILLWNGGVHESENLCIPHRHLAVRRFALLPLCEIARDEAIPPSGATVEAMLGVCPDTSGVVAKGEIC